MSAPYPKMLELRPAFREKMIALFEELEWRGYQPKISNAYRTAEQQLEKVKQGYAPKSCTDPGTHNWGLACDCIDRRWGWEGKHAADAARFFGVLHDLAVAAGLTSGGGWFGKGGTRDEPTHPSPWNAYGLGYDPAHVEDSHAPAEERTDYGPEHRPDQEEKS